jgi:heme exporter protein D
MTDIKAFLDMGGYALYVWGSFGMTALLMIAEPLLLRSRRKAVIRRLARMIRINERNTSDESQA